MAYRGWKGAAKHHRRLAVRQHLRGRTSELILPRLRDTEAVIEALSGTKWSAEEIANSAEDLALAVAMNKCVVIREELDEYVFADAVAHAVLPAKRRLYHMDHQHGVNRCVQKCVDELNALCEALGLDARCPPLEAE